MASDYEYCVLSVETLFNDSLPLTQNSRINKIFCIMLLGALIPLRRNNFQNVFAR